ncbi:MAG TPA: hypothetical protein PLE06_09480 [Thiobacillus sp.]|nr:hypothetical protein [Thiobacillus sp.]
MLKVAGRGDQAGYLLTAQHHRQRVRHVDRLHLGCQLGLVGGDVEEELQPGDRRIERDRRDAVINQVQLVVAQVLHAGGVGWPVQIAGELSHRAQIVALCLGGRLAHPHVVEHALAKRTDSFMGRFHGSAPVEKRGGLPHSST